ncbi:ComF family protein [Streptomyces sp. CRN 30]|uniref:ComF family protein n=1 Tax=Streptomyces sp. CRN 30 TaxID=3075613 RepID=UPI002A7F691E|nr:ComF family protein [Streptomyces sp. CRN 30]
MRGWWQDLTDLVLPAECAGCGRPRALLCPECRDAVGRAGPRRVRPVPEPPGLPVVHAVAPYADEVRALLLAHKERGALGLAAPLGTALAGAVRAGLRGTGAEQVNGHGAGAVPDGVRGVGPAPAGRRDATAVPPVAQGGAAVREPVLLVPVPSSRGAVRARGHDPARRIALAAAGELRRTGTPARVLGVLRQRRPVADQAGLDSRQRLENLAGALAVAAGGGRLLAGGRIVLVDDLMTTGASLAEAARALRAARRETAVYDGMAREGRAQWTAGVTTATEEEPVSSRTGEAYRSEGVLGRASRDTAGDAVRAAVVAASPESFEMNRN